MNSTAPSTPSGTTSSTATGIDQLSYSAARHRNTTTIDSTISIVRGIAGEDFLVRLAGPVEAEARRQIVVDDLLHRVHRFAGGVPGAWRTDDLDRRIAVVAGQRRRATHPTSC